ncbi:MAG: tRNA adenosine(34) deaminase TadA [Synergistetes bacterium]|nr:tRNA adenosine(34) deaminase TadA [Synergistota bacterium]
MDVLNIDEYFMRIALEEARKAADEDEVPVGAVGVIGDEIVARAHNRREQLQDPLAHAELFVIREAALRLRSWRLVDLVIYVTLEPCPMCAGAMVQARIKRLVYGLADPRSGAAGSVMNILQHESLNHSVEVKGGILAEESRELLRAFFSRKRNK